MPEQWYFLVVLGLACGLLGGLLGIGGGVLMVPALVMLAFPQKDAQGMALAAMIPMAIVGAIRYKVNPDIHFEMSTVGLLAIGGVCGVLIGAWLAGVLDSLWLRRMFACLLVVIAFKLIISAPQKPEPMVRQDAGDMLSDSSDT